MIAWESTNGPDRADGELAAIVAVLLDGVLVVDAGDEALVSDEEQARPGAS